MKLFVIFLASLLEAVSLCAQSKPINQHLTKFILPYEESNVEGAGYSFGEKTAKRILSKKSQLVQLAYPNGEALGCENYIDKYSFVIRNDSIYYHLYEFKKEYTFLDNGEGVYIIKPHVFYPIHYSVKDTLKEKGLGESYRNALAIYHSTLKRKSKK